MQQNIRRKLTKFAAIGLSSAMLLVSTPLTFADAAETQNPIVANTQAKSLYDAQFQVNVKNYKNNGGQYSSSSLALAFDGNTNTHWETGNSNSNSFKNHVIAEFENEEIIDSISYFPRVSGTANKGYPTAFTVYGTQDENVFDENAEWTEIHKGITGVVSGELKIKFKKDETVKGIKFVFDEAHNGFAAASEFKFYKPDHLADEVDALFTDGTMSQVKEDITVEKLNELKNDVQSHPSKQELEDRIKLAEDILNKTKDVKGEVFEVEQRGNEESHARGTLRTSSLGTNLLPTGIAAMKGDTVKVYVDVEEGKPLPQIAFTQQVGHWKGWKQVYNLKQGENIFTVPSFYEQEWKQNVEKGGAIYIVYPYDKETGGNPKVRIEGGHEYPIFKDGDDVEEFRKELVEYKAKLAKEPTEYIDIVELVSDYAILNSNMKSAEVFLRENNPKSPQDSIDHNKERISQYLALAGISEEGEDKHIRNGARVNMRLMQPWAGAYASGDHTGFQQSTIDVVFNGDNYDWAIAHELGHQFDVQGGHVKEVTNNMWANYNQVVINGEGDRVDDLAYEAIFTKTSAFNYAELDNKNMSTLAMWWQLYLYDQNYWVNYNKAFRNGVFDKFNKQINDNERMVLASSYALNMDMTEHFVRHKFIDQATADKLKPMLAELNIPEKPEHIKPWYMWTKAVKSDVKTFTQKYTPEIVDVRKVGNQVELKIEIDDSAQEALLGFEVLQDGKTIGFTNSNIFTTIQNDAKSHTYQVRAYDLKQNVTNYSNKVTFDSSAPTVKVTKSTIIEAGTPVDVLDYVSAYSDGGSVLDVKQLTSGSVNSNLHGFYTFTFGATDKYNKSSTEQVRFHTVAEVVYASDLEEVSATTGSGGLKKNKDINNDKITLYVNGQEQSFEKGLGAHADSEIVYQVNGEYDLFEAFIGLDGAVRKEHFADATFKVLADDKVIYESGIFSNRTEMEHIILDIKGANKVTLITSSNGDKDYDHTVWADAKFAKTN